MKPAVADYVRRQTATLMRSLNDAASFPIGVVNPERTVQIGSGASWQWVDSARHRAFIRRPPLSDAEFWVHVDYAGYRGAFLQFLESEFRLSRSEVASHWHVDHILNRAFARRYGIEFVRLALLDKASNSGHGSTIERGLSQASSGGKQTYLMDLAVMMKLLGIAPLRSRQDYDGRRKDIAASFVARGYGGTVVTALQDIDNFFKLWPEAFLEP